jgi:diamine N-acetyltransferase
MMHLRKLETQDAPLMLEWMHDGSVTRDLQADFASKDLADCEKFISESWLDGQNYHLAIVDESNTYLGTASLKHIHNNEAEFAIAIRTAAMGRGIAAEAMKNTIKIGFEEKNLTSIYWCVSPENARAVRFYDKNGYGRVSPSDLKIPEGYSKQQIQQYWWYRITKDAWLAARG